MEFRSVVDAVRCAIEVQNAMIDRNAGVPEDRRIEFRIGVHVGDVVGRATLLMDEESISPRAWKGSPTGAICLSESATGRSKPGSTSKSVISARPNARTLRTLFASFRSMSGFSTRLIEKAVERPMAETRRSDLPFQIGFRSPSCHSRT